MSLTRLQKERNGLRGGSFAAAGALLTAVILTASGLQAQPPAAPPQTEPGKASKDSRDVNPKEFAEAMRKAMENIPADADPETVRRAIMEVWARHHQRRFPLGIPGGFTGGGPGMFQPIIRLGIFGSPPSETLADQFELPFGHGLVLEQIQPNSAAAKAGLKKNDILLELAGKPVPSNFAEMAKLVGEIKADAPVDAVVFRKGKKETVKGITLPEANEWKMPGGGPGAAFVPQPAAQARAGGNTNTNRLVFRHQDAAPDGGKLTISLAGNLVEGKLQVEAIQLKDAAGDHKYDRLDQVPEKYRDKVKKVVEMSEKQ